MVDLTAFFTSANVGLGLAAIAILLLFIFYAKFPEKKSSKKGRKKKK